MGTTSKYALRYPELADMANANTGFKNLATDVEAAGPMAWAQPPHLFVPGNVLIGTATDNTVGLSRRAANTLGLLGSYASQGAVGGWGFMAYVDSETQPRAYLRNDGYLLFGPGGSTVLDTNLYRGGAGRLQTDGSLYLLTASGYLGIWQPGDAALRWNVRYDGYVTWGSGSAGGDTVLYRAAAGWLRTDGVFFGDLAVTAASVTTARTGGAAAALPAAPVRYIAMRDENFNRVYVPAYS